MYNLSYIYISDERVGWIEARKMCAKRNSVLASMQTRDKRTARRGVVRRQMRRRRDEFWLAGNDIEEEGVWQWEGRRARGTGVASGWGWREAGEEYRGWEGGRARGWSAEWRREAGGRMSELGCQR